MINRITDRIMAMAMLAGDANRRGSMITDFDEAAVTRLVESAVFTVERRSGLTVRTNRDGVTEIVTLSGAPVDSFVLADIEDAVVDMVSRATGLDGAGESAGWVASDTLPKIKPYNI